MFVGFAKSYTSPWRTASSGTRPNSPPKIHGTGGDKRSLNRVEPWDHLDIEVGIASLQIVDHIGDPHASFRGDPLRDVNERGLHPDAKAHIMGEPIGEQ